MGRYMTVVLKEQYKKEPFIQALNEELAIKYGSNASVTFNTWQYVQEQADYFNEHPEGKKQFREWNRPIAKETLHENFFWYRMGKFSFRLNGDVTAEEARDAIAVCKWVMKTRGKYIDKNKSVNYNPPVVKQYLNYLFKESGYSLSVLWKLPKEK